MENKSALIVGATGLIGSDLLDKLLDEEYYQYIYILTRRPLGRKHERIKELIVDFDEFDEEMIPKIDDVYCCLGTTMKKAGSKSAFRKIDYHYPLKIAQITQQKGAQQYLLVSALGANRKSRFFYNRVKGEVETAVAAIGFRALHIFRPSILLGQRQESRSGEKIGQTLMQLASPILIGSLRKYRPIKSSVVAQAMQKVAKKDLHGSYIFESDKIKTLAVAS